MRVDFESRKGRKWRFRQLRKREGLLGGGENKCFFIFQGWRVGFVFQNFFQLKENLEVIQVNCDVGGFQGLGFLDLKLGKFQ